VNKATRRTPNAANLFDVVATSSSALVSNVKVIDVDHISDHRLIIAEVVVRVPRPITTYTSRNIRAVDATLFESALRQSELFSRPATTVDEYVSQLNDVLTHLLDKFAPARTRRRPLRRLSLSGFLLRLSKPSAHVGASNDDGGQLAMRLIDLRTGAIVAKRTS